WPPGSTARDAQSRRGRTPNALDTVPAEAARRRDSSYQFGFRSLGGLIPPPSAAASEPIRVRIVAILLRASLISSVLISSNAASLICISLGSRLATIWQNFDGSDVDIVSKAHFL